MLEARGPFPQYVVDFPFQASGLNYIFNLHRRRYTGHRDCLRHSGNVNKLCTEWCGSGSVGFESPQHVVLIAHKSLVKFSVGHGFGTLIAVEASLLLHGSLKVREKLMTWPIAT